MHSSITLLAVPAILFELASAHGFVQGVTVDGDWTLGSNPNWYYLPDDQVPTTAGWDALNQDNGFVAPDAYQTTDIACHKSATPGGLYAEIDAGDDITFYWNTWPDTHKGPIMNYIAPCTGECTSETAGDLKFVKISQDAIVDASSQTWVTDTMIANNFSASVTIPSSLAAGNYVIRHEIIALHSAGNVDGAQSYPQCINLKVTGGGSASPSGIPATEFYTEDEDGIIFDLYSSYTTYPFPGPDVWTG